MIWAVTDIAFLVAMLLVIALFYVLSGKAVNIAQRLTRLWEPPVREATVGFKERQKARLGALLQGMGKLIPQAKENKENKGSGKLQKQFLRAGFRRPEAIMVLRGAKLVLSIGLLSAVYFTGFYQKNPFLILLLAVAIGFFGPDFYVTRKIRKRQRRLTIGLPDALDLLVICVEAGLALDQALIRVSLELRIAHPELSEELDIVTAEIRLGKARNEALRELGARTGVEDIRALVAMLIQTDKFGTSIAQSLRVNADTLRSKRRQRAEEAAAKTSVKMVPALVFFIFPALFVAILGPAVILIAREFIQK
jgi:tight adherence protein C